LQHSPDQFVVAQVAVARQAIQSMQFQVILEPFHAKETQLGRAAHLREVFEA
jgi:hypothetical protein